MSAQGLNGASSRQCPPWILEFAAPNLLRVAAGLEGLVQRMIPALLRLSQVIEQIEQLPAVPAYESFLIQRGRNPSEARFLAPMLIKYGAAVSVEQLAERKLASAISQLLKNHDASLLIISRRAKALRRALEDPSVEASFRRACSSAEIFEPIKLLKDLITRASYRDEVACRRVVEISKALRPCLRNPRGRVAEVASITHELLLDLQDRAYTYNPIDDEMTDSSTLSTRAAMNDSAFDPRPAWRRFKQTRQG